MAYFEKVEIEKTISPLVIAALGQEKASSTLAIKVLEDDTVINVTDATGMIAGQTLFIVDEANVLVEQFTILSVEINAITVDMPSGNDYAVGLFVGSSNINMAVDGSSSPVTFNLKTGLESADITVRITRIMITMHTTDAPKLSEFGNIVGGLTNGCYLRVINGTNSTLFNAKTNQDLANLAYDLDFYTAAGAGNDGLKCRMTFTRMGSEIELAQNEDIQLIVQDDLETLTNLVMYVEGYFVT